jgi:hypothetical protein
MTGAPPLPAPPANLRILAGRSRAGGHEQHEACHQEHKDRL